LLEACGGIVKTVPRQDLIPRLSTGLLHTSAHAAIGSLFVQPKVLWQGQPRLLDDVAGAGWRIVLATDACDWVLSVHAETFNLLKFSSVAKAGTLQEIDQVLSNWFAAHAVQAAIVRPDHYVYAVASDAQELSAQIIQLQDKFNGVLS
jgi:3-(3-hydroxy-phenyl)propionate hydroxylase